MKINAKSFLELKFLSDPVFSPDGKNAAFSVKWASLEDNSYKGDIYLLNQETGNVIKMISEAKNFYWEKNGKLLFKAARDKNIKEREAKGEKLTAFYEIAIDGGEASLAFTLPLKVQDIEDLGDGNYILTAKEDLRYPDLEGMDEEEKKKALEKYSHPAYEKFTELPFWGNGLGYLSEKRTSLYIYNRNDSSLKKLTGYRFSVSDYKISGSKIVYEGGSYDNVKHIFPGLYMYDMEKGEETCFISPDTYKLGQFEFLDADTLLLALTEGGKFGDQEYCDFYKLDLKTGERKLFKAFDGPIGRSTIGSDSRLGGGIALKKDGDKVYFITTKDEAAPLMSIDKEGNIEEVYNRGGSVDSFDIKDGKVLLCAMEGNSLDELYDINGNKLTHFNDEFTSSHDIVTPEPYNFINSDGVEIRGWAVKPVGFEEGKKYPCILDVHGGPRTAFGSVYYNEMQLWANNGFFVIFCNPRGSDGRGAEFGYITGKYGSIDFKDLMEFTDEMVKKYPEIDENRLGIAGGSYGGFMTNWAIGHTNRFKAAASQRSISDWISFEHTTDIGYYFTKSQMGVTTREDVNKVWDFSPLKYADKVTTPTLFIHSDEDYRCWKVEGLSMFTALKMFGVPSRLCLFKGDNHELSRSGSVRNRLRRLEEILSWMEKYLGE